MIIHVAETGKSFELADLHPDSTIAHLQRVLTALTGVSEHDQLLFAANARLDPHKTLSHYSLQLQHDDEQGSHQPVFLFNRERLLQNSPPPLPELLPINVDPVLPDLPSRQSSGETSWRQSYETQYMFHFQKGSALLTASRNKVDACKTLMREMEVQQMALRTVRCSMECHYRSIDQWYAEFAREFVRVRREREDALGAFENDLERLRACKVHPALRTRSRCSLIDLVKEDCMRKSAEEFAMFHRQLCGKVDALADEYSVLKSNVEEFLGLSDRVNLEHLRSTLEAYSRFPDEQGVILESLKDDVLKVRRLAEGHDAFLALGAIYDVQVNNHLPRMEECDYKLGKLLHLMVEKKNVMSLCVHQRMQRTASLQASIKVMRNEVTGFNEALTHKSANFEVVKMARRIGSSYKTCLAEVVRRREYMKLYMGQAGELAEQVAVKREKEKVRREEFLHQHSILPQDLLMAMGLLDVPSQCVVNIAPFDTMLLDIQLADVEKYAPQYLTGALRTAMDWPDDKAEDDTAVNHSDSYRLEVENARLKAQLASSVAIICSLDSSFRPESLGDDDKLKSGDGGESLTAFERTSEALRLKDEHAVQLRKIIEEKQSQCDSYEARIRELEERLREHGESGFASPHMEVESSGVSEEQLMDSHTAGNHPEVSSSAGEELEKVAAPPAALVEEDQVTSTSLQDVMGLLRECQMNSADLEKKLHEAREEARIHLCAADRRAAEYNVLRASSVKLRGLLQRLRNCIASTGGSSFTDALRALSASVKSDATDEVGMEFQSFIKLLSERLMALSQQRAELMERCSASEACQAQLRKEAENKGEMAKSYFAKLKQEKQVP